MSQELINTVLQGDVNAVTALLESNPSTDINFIGSVRFAQIVNYDNPYVEQVSCSALSVAAALGKFAIVKFLLEKGALVEPLGSGPHLPASNALIGHCFTYISSATEARRDLNIFILLLQNAKDINPGFDSNLKGNLHSANLFELLTLSREMGSEYTTRLMNSFGPKLRQYSLFEAIITNQKDLAEKLLSKFKDLFADHQPFCEYIATRKLTPSQASNTLKCLSFFVEKGLIDTATSDHLITLIRKTVVYSAELGNFPEAIHPLLKNPPKNTLAELFSKFRQLLCPEENLPSLPVISLQPPDLLEFASENETQVQTLERIKHKQNPVHLQALIILDNTELIFRLYNCNALDGSNEAVLLLAQMLLYKYNEPVTLDKKTSLLNKEQQQICFSLLHRFFSLSETEKLSMKSLGKYSQEIQYLRLENSELKAEIILLKSELADLSTQVKSLMSQMQLVLKRTDLKEMNTEQAGRASQGFF